ncbi:protein Smaug homolog 2-like [Nilaparvata lugens]|uniref:protein Smaug homolog 2-like n=1 Tax=Nilaparvata lugens TaxID=108931 RepID=UPI00193CC8F7|nr:protein Smaug homolog 2-like [Nilaparvata lugens]
MEGSSEKSAKNSTPYSKMMMVIWSFWSWDLQMQAEALVKIFCGLCPVMARLLCAIVVQTLQETINPKIEKQENDANNPDFVRQLFDSHDIDLEKLFEYLAFLKPSNVETKHVYISFLPAVFRNCIQQSTKIDQAKNLLQVVLIHPSFRDSRREFEHFKFQLLYSGNDTRETASASVLPPPMSPIQENDESNQKKLLSKQLSQIEAILKDEKPEQRNLLGAEKVQRSNGAFTKRPRNLNPWNDGAVREEHTPKNNNSKSGMKDLYNWLKFLRLHKYFIQFERLSYEELLSLDETNFDMLVPGVTQGAKRKFLITIEGLRQRYRTLVSIDQTIETMSGDCLSSVMDQLQLMIFSPMKPPTEALKKTPDDIPYFYFHVLRKILLRLLENRLGDDECIKRLRTLIYLTLRNEAFAPYTPALNAMKSRLYANEPLRNSTTATYLRTVSQQGGFRNAWKRNPLLSAAPATLTRPLFIQIPDLTPQPSGLQAAEFERINHPQYESQAVDDVPLTHEESSSDTLWRAVGSGVRSQQNSTSSSGFSSMRSQLNSTSSSGMRSQQNSTSSSFGVDSFWSRSPPDERTATTFAYVGRSYSAGAVDLRAEAGAGTAAGYGATASAQQRTRGQSWSAGETYSDYKLFSDNDECDLFKEIWKVGLSDWKSYEFDDFGHF